MYFSVFIGQSEQRWRLADFGNLGTGHPGTSENGQRDEQNGCFRGDVRHRYDVSTFVM